MAARDIDDLHAAAPAEFVQARNALARRLREAGRTADAAGVQRLRKPSPALWVVNQVARQDPEGLTRFIEAVDQLKRTHLGSPGELAQATRQQRDALDRLLHRATRALTGAGLQPSPALLGRVSATLRGAAADLQARKELQAGRLREEREAPGFEVFADTPLPARPRTARAGGTRTTAAIADRGQARAREDLERARAHAVELHERATALETSAAGHRQALAQAARAVDELAERLRQARQAMRRAREVAAGAERQARQAREQAERARARAR